eukprot:CAMPEP_0171499350 /NCGR_PEP_ID=MMETSP0958-20121227/8385_1 /TAXON_ID=87120 /ORGANISM="Aurantiochytrium limacinum, Strain ATCCMYA-1381" /LENGTH=264 /DNA_ID=CAMNT_0012033907 /DNA_START=218 /DNA_END=1012 /DNA_ORIENTATION=-
MTMPSTPLHAPESVPSPPSPSAPLESSSSATCDQQSSPLGPKLESMLAGVDCKVKDEIHESLDVLREALNKYEFNQLALSFNGGKDCTVVLHLLRVVLEEKFPGCRPDRRLSAFKVVYFKKVDEFPEMHAFVDQIKATYGITVDVYPSSYKEGLAMMELSGIKAVLMGQRRTDPYAVNLNHFEHCSPGWPDIVRINPILNWSYRTIWAFLRGCELEYCKLYDEGYTSLGSIHTTQKNPKLVRGDSSLPAYELDEGDKFERVSRS